MSGEKQRWEDSRQREEEEGGGAWRGDRKLEGPERQPVFNWELGGASIPAFFRLLRDFQGLLDKTLVRGVAGDEDPRAPCHEPEWELRHR